MASSSSISSSRGNDLAPLSLVAALADGRQKYFQTAWSMNRQQRLCWWLAASSRAVLVKASPLADQMFETVWLEAGTTACTAFGLL
jgi:hypothetical protein